MVILGPEAELQPTYNDYKYRQSWIRNPRHPGTNIKIMWTTLPSNLNYPKERIGLLSYGHFGPVYVKYNLGVS